MILDHMHQSLLSICEYWLLAFPQKPAGLEVWSRRWKSAITASPLGKWDFSEACETFS